MQPQLVHMVMRGSKASCEQSWHNKANHIAHAKNACAGLAHARLCWRRSMMEIHTELIAVGDTKVINPTTNKLAGFKQLVAHRYTPVAIR